MSRESHLNGYSSAVLSEIPPDIVVEAQEIVDRQRPHYIDAGFNPLMSLSVEEQTLLNNPDIFPGGNEERENYIDRLRERYAGDKEAQRQLDGYDSRSNLFQEWIRKRNNLLASLSKKEDSE